MLFGAENVRTLHLTSMAEIEEDQHVNITKGLYSKK